MVIKKRSKKSKVATKKKVVTCDDLHMAKALSVFDKLSPVLLDVGGDSVKYFKIAYGEWIDGRRIDFGAIDSVFETGKTKRIVNSMYNRIRDKFEQFKCDFYFKLPEIINNFVFNFFADKKYKVNRTTIIIILSRILKDFGYDNHIKTYYYYNEDGITFANGDTIKPSIEIGCYLMIDDFSSEMYSEDLSVDFNYFKLLVRKYLEYRNINAYHDVDCPCFKIRPVNNKNHKSDELIILPHPRERLIMQIENIITGCNCNTHNNALQLLRIVDLQFTDLVFNHKGAEYDDKINTVKSQLHYESMIYLGNSKWISIRQLTNEIESGLSVYISRCC